MNDEQWLTAKRVFLKAPLFVILRREAPKNLPAGRKKARFFARYARSE